MAMDMETIMLVERTISGATGESGAGDGASSLKLIFIVVFIAGIALLAQFISRRSRRK